MRAPRKLVDYPYVEVRVDCTYCKRHGRYRLARLAARYGPEQSLEGLLADLAQNCPWWRTNPRKYEPRCAARFTDLERDLPPPDIPEGTPRRRQPSRESLPNLKRIGAPEDKTPMLSGWGDPDIVLECAKCNRRDVLSVADLLVGGDAPIDLIWRWAKNCPHRNLSAMAGCCEARFERVLPQQRRQPWLGTTPA